MFRMTSKSYTGGALLLFEHAATNRVGSFARSARSTHYVRKIVDETMESPQRREINYQNDEVHHVPQRFGCYPLPFRTVGTQSVWPGISPLCGCTAVKVHAYSRQVRACYYGGVE